MDSTSSITQLSTEEALQFLSERSFGRLAVSLQGRPDIFPVNFAMHAKSSDDVVAYIRTSPGNKLFATASGSHLALETDTIQDATATSAPDTTATSAIVYGVGRIVQHHEELELVDSLGLKAWIAERKPEVVAIDVEHISGRTFVLGPGPETTIDETPD